MTERNNHSLLRRPGLAAVWLVMLSAATGVAAQQQIVPNVVQLDAEEEAAPRYAVEMIVFEYADSAANTTEIFEPEVAVEVLSDEAFFGTLPPELTNQDPAAVYSDRPDDPAAEAARPAENERSLANQSEEGEEAPFVLLPGETLEEIPTYENAGIELLDPAEYQLVSAWEKLVDLDAYRPLMHTGWIQPTLEKEETQPLSVRRMGNPPLRLDGHITLYLSRFLHLVLDLSLEHRTPGAAPPAVDAVRYYGDSRSRASLSFEPNFAPPSVIYRINEDRILRNNEIRYYDHPKFGVIARVTRIEETMPEEPDTTDDLLPGDPAP